MQLATITSKRQLTIPASIFRKAGLKQGQKVLISLHDNEIQIKPAVDLVEELAGSIKTPKRFRNLTPDQIISKAKKEYFARTK